MTITLDKLKKILAEVASVLFEEMTGVIGLTATIAAQLVPDWLRPYFIVSGVIFFTFYCAEKAGARAGRAAAAKWVLGIIDIIEREKALDRKMEAMEKDNELKAEKT